MALIHAETSTGALQPGIADITAAAHRNGALVVLDTVTSLGGVPVEIDTWGVDIAYSATQKCLSCPPGLSPLTASDRALEVINNRRTPVPNWYLDLSQVVKYWGKERTYHHTAPINMNYALREAPMANRAYHVLSNAKRNESFVIRKNERVLLNTVHPLF